MHTVLSRPWANYLVLTILRQGEGSDEWKNALRFADEFVWSAQPKTTENDITRLRALLPQLEKALRHGLATVAYHDSDVKQLMGELSQFYRKLLDGQKIETRTAKDVIEHNVAAPAPVAGVDLPIADGATPTAPQSPVEEIVLSSEPPEEAEVPPEAEDEVVQGVRDLKVGTWLEFIEENGQRERAKLSWISPISQKYLFVNRRGQGDCGHCTGSCCGTAGQHSKPRRGPRRARDQPAGVVAAAADGWASSPAPRRRATIASSARSNSGTSSSTTALPRRSSAARP